MRKKSKATQQVESVVECAVFVSEECVCPASRPLTAEPCVCGEALVFFCGRALRWDICLKSIVVARLVSHTFVLNLFCGFRVLFCLWCVGVCFR